jgi:glycosyltransferase involved in cell wall biosynthesis
MKILWVTTTPRKKIREIFEMNCGSDSSGTWIDTAYDDLKKAKGDIEFQIDFASGDKGLKVGQIKKAAKNNESAFITGLSKISFGKSGGKKSIQAWKSILNDSKPDIIHLWGSESSVAFDITKANDTHIPMVIFVQGAVGIHSLYYAGDIIKEPLKCHTLEWFYQSLIVKIKQQYLQKQYSLEKTIVDASEGIITDNDFSKLYFKSEKEDAHFYDMPLPINEAFKNASWDIQKIDRHTIFTVFGSDPNKGLHQLLKAIIIVKRIYPDVRIVFPGPYSISISPKKQKHNMSLFEMWAYKFIRQNNLQNNVCFIGKLNPFQMASELAKCNVFVSPSCMEVHAGSVRESMFVGAPTITTDCGSVLEFAKNKENALIYRYKEYQILAEDILSVFENDSLACKLGFNAKKDIVKFYSSFANSQSLADVYTDLAKNRSH